jgi:hypothetical protein
MSTEYTVQFGDTLVLIPKRHGFASWREVYYHDDNFRFRLKRPNPDKIFPGDVLMIPDGRRTTPVPPTDDSEYEGFGADDKRTVQEAIERAIRLMRAAMLRLNFNPALSNRVNLDTKMKVLNVFKINLFTISDMAFPEDFPRWPGFSSYPEVPANPNLQQHYFQQLKMRYTRILDGVDDKYRKIRHEPGEEFRCSMYGAFVVPGDSTMHFCPSFFDDAAHPGDKRAVTILHERAHTLIPEPGHPGTEFNTHVTVVPHLGKFDMRVGQALQNPYCYEWLTQALQATYNPCDHIGPEHGLGGCGTQPRMPATI